MCHHNKFCYHYFSLTTLKKCTNSSTCLTYLTDPGYWPRYQNRYSPTRSGLVTCSTANCSIPRPNLDIGTAKGPLCWPYKPTMGYIVHTHHTVNVEGGECMCVYMYLYECTVCACMYTCTYMCICKLYKRGTH